MGQFSDDRLAKLVMWFYGKPLLCLILGPAYWRRHPIEALKTMIVPPIVQGLLISLVIWVASWW